MKASSVDWSVIRGALIGMACSVILGCLLVGGSLYFREQIRREYRNNNSQFQNISRKYLAVDEEERLVQQYYPKFITLHNEGVIGEERRLDWIEVLREAEREIRLPSLSYSIESQKVYSPTYPVNLKRFQLHRSVMKLTMQLLHEGDLFSLLDTLDRKTQGNYSVTECLLHNNTPGRQLEDPDAGNVNAECKLEWFTIKLANGARIKI